jgi:hypothetical protein
LLAYCGGGQDKPGFLGPSAETPALFFRDKKFVTSKLKKSASAENQEKPSAANHRKTKRSAGANTLPFAAAASGYLFAALSHGAGDFHRVFARR